MHGEAVDLAAVHDERNGLGRFAERNRQAAGGERVERAGVPRALAREQPLDGADGLRRGHADRLVEHDPAVDVALVAAELLLAFSARRLVLRGARSSGLILRRARSARLEGWRESAPMLRDAGFAGSSA